MKNKNWVISCVVILSLLIASCSGDKEGGSGIKEGTIVYDAKVVDETNPMASMAPSKMTLNFKNDQCNVEMSAGMGFFTTTFLSDPEKKTLTQLVQLLNKKYSLVLNMDSIKEDIKDYPLIITETKETKMIAGFSCKKIHVKVDNATQDEFDAYYTEDINIKDPNFATPYFKVNGVLMEYQMKKFGLEMRFTAKSVTENPVDDKLFEFTNDYKSVTQEEMEQIFMGFM